MQEFAKPILIPALGNPWFRDLRKPAQHDAR